MTGPRFFTTEQRNGHWWFVTPEGQPFWSIGLNHIDSATLRYGDSGGVWQSKYGNSEERWLHCPKSNPKGPWFDPKRLETETTANRETDEWVRDEAY